MRLDEPFTLRILLNGKCLFRNRFIQQSSVAPCHSILLNDLHTIFKEINIRDDRHMAWVAIVICVIKNENVEFLWGCFRTIRKCNKTFF